jgi:nitroimidazol reductase NimA-like FMN-containing flavoprotein (pyridoxamine 5'-phosphate oxidase superfamily)
MNDIVPARGLEQRKLDTLRLLEQEIDAWVSTADPGSGTPYLVPLSFLWDGTTLLLATFRTSPTARNLQVTGTVRIGLGATRDVVLVVGTAEAIETTEISSETGDAFAAKTGFDPRRSTSPFLYFRVTPVQIQAWREENELANRTIMRDGMWIQG